MTFVAVTAVDLSSSGSPSLPSFPGQWGNYCFQTPLKRLCFTGSPQGHSTDRTKCVSELNTGFQGEDRVTWVVSSLGAIKFSYQSIEAQDYHITLPSCKEENMSVNLTTYPSHGQHPDLLSSR